MAERELPTAGKAAYEKFCELGGYAGFQFEGLSDEGKAGWEAVADAAIEAHLELCEANPEGLGPIARDMDVEELTRFRENDIAIDRDADAIPFYTDKTNLYGVTSPHRDV